MPQRRRDRVQAMQQQELNAARRRRGLIIGGVVLAVLAVVVGVGIAVQQDRAGEPAGTVSPPQGTVGSFGIPAARPRRR